MMWERLVLLEDNINEVSCIRKHSLITRVGVYLESWMIFSNHSTSLEGVEISSPVSKDVYTFLIAKLMWTF